jgi:integrase
MSRIVYRITDEYALVERKGSANLYLEWREGGQKVGRSTGHRSLDDAKRRARELILEIGEIKDAEPGEMQIAVVLDRYWFQHAQKIASKDAARAGRALWKEYWGEEKTVADLTVTGQEKFVAWLREKGFAEGYVRRVLGVGKSALNWAWKRGEIKQVPFIALPPIGEAYPHYATRAQLVKLLNAEMPDHVWTYCLIRLTTGCRDDAARDLQPFQIDRDANLVRLNPAGRLQTKKYRPVVPLTRTLARHIATLPATGFYVAWHGEKIVSIKTTWRKLRKAAGLPVWFAPKVLRHTVATELRRRGVPGWEVSGQLGHKVGGTTEIYAKFDPAYLGKARKALDAWMADLAKDVPRLRGVTSGSVGRTNENGENPKASPFQPLMVVGGTGFEPVTPTMSRSRKIKRNKD